ncbi:hypothetical protein CR513_58015, partial [Mucuna pruriens]
MLFRDNETVTCSGFSCDYRWDVVSWPYVILLPSHHQSDFFLIRVVSELFGLKSVILARIMKGNTNIM